MKKPWISLKRKGRVTLTKTQIRALKRSDSSEYIVNLTSTPVIIDDVFDSNGQFLLLNGYELVDLKNYVIASTKGISRAIKFKVIRYASW